MKKLTGIVMMLSASVLMAGCYSKSCDTACPSNAEKVKLVDAKPVTAKDIKEAEAPPAADPVKKAGADAEAASSAAAESAAKM